MKVQALFANGISFEIIKLPRALDSFLNDHLAASVLSGPVSSSGVFEFLNCYINKSVFAWVFDNTRSVLFKGAKF